MPAAGNTLRWWMPVALVAAVFAVYSNTLQSPFVLDDFGAIVQNGRIRTLWPPPLEVFRPVSQITFALNYALHGLDLPGWHLTNMGLHALAALALMGVVRLLLLLPCFDARWEATAAWVAFATALLWAVHPLQTMPVTNVNHRHETLAALFVFLCLYAYLRALGSPRRRWWLAGSVVAAVLAVGSKEHAALAPVLLVVFDRMLAKGAWCGCGASRERLWFYAGLVACLALASALVMAGRISEKADGFIGFTNARHILWWEYAISQLGVFPHYLRLVVWPWPLSVSYADWPVAGSLGEVFFGGLTVLVAVGLTLYALLRRSSLGLAGLWVFLFLLPTSSIYPLAAELLAERRMVLPLAAPVLLAVLAVAAWRGKPKWVPVGLLFIAAGALGWTSHARNGDFRSELALWEQTARVRPSNYLAWWNLGHAHMRQNDVAGAMPYYERVLALGGGDAFLRTFGPTFRQTEEGRRFVAGIVAPWHKMVADLCLQMGRGEDAGNLLQRALINDPRDPRAHAWLGEFHGKSGRLEEARQWLAQAEALGPHTQETARELAGVYTDLGWNDEALKALRRCLELDSGDAGTWNDFGACLAMAGDWAGARRAFERAIELQPHYAHAEANLAYVLEQAGFIDEARIHAERAVHLEPESDVFRAGFDAMQKAPNGSP